MVSNFKTYKHKINFSLQIKINAAKYGTNSAVPTIRIYGIKFPHKLVQYGNGFID